MSNYQFIRTLSFVLLLLQSILFSSPLLASSQEASMPNTVQASKMKREEVKARKGKKGKIDFGRFWFFRITDKLKPPRMPRCTNVICAIFMPIIAVVYALCVIGLVGCLLFIAAGVVAFTVFIALLNIAIWWKLIILGAVIIGPQLGILLHEKFQQFKAARQKRKRIKQIKKQMA